MSPQASSSNDSRGGGSLIHFYLTLLLEGSLPSGHPVIRLITVTVKHLQVQTLIQLPVPVGPRRLQSYNDNTGVKKRGEKGGEGDGMGRRRGGKATGWEGDGAGLETFRDIGQFLGC